MSQKTGLEILRCVVVLKVFSKKTQLFGSKKLFRQGGIDCRQSALATTLICRRFTALLPVLIPQPSCCCQQQE
jgi:hypothetical protein